MNYRIEEFQEIKRKSVGKKKKKMKHILLKKIVFHLNELGSVNSSGNV